MRTIPMKNADKAQLEEEIAARGLTGVTVRQVNGDVFVDVPDEVDGVKVDYALREHFPRSLVAAILAVDFEAVDYDSLALPVPVKAELNKMKQRNIQLRNRTAAVLKAMLKQE